MKKFITLFLPVMFVLGMLVSCNSNESEEPVSDIQLTDEETPIGTEEISTLVDTEEANTLDGAIFSTKNIKSITFYAYSGNGKGSEVPAESTSEFITWLETFTIDQKVDDLLPPGTNNYYVEIEYLDGTITKKGLDVIEIDGVAYYLKHAAYPDSFMDIISKTSYWD